MTQYDDAWVKAEETKRAFMDANSLYKSEDEHSSCGVGLVVAIADGDTLTVLNEDFQQVKVRLAEIDAPDMQVPSKKS